MAVLNALQRLIFEGPAWRLIAVLLGIMLFRTGIWYVPNMPAVAEIAINPFLNPFTDPNAQYNFWSWLGPYWAYVVGARDFPKFFLFHLAFSVAFTALLISILFWRLPNRLARIALVLFMMIPASATAYFWVGLDSVTLTLMTAALAFPRRAFVVAPIGVLLGMQHFEQGSFAAAALIFAIGLGKFLDDRGEYGLKFGVALLVGVIAGRVLLLGIFSYFGVEAEAGRMHWLAAHYKELLAGTFYHLHATVFSVLGVGWLAVVRYFDLGRRATPFLLTLAGLLLLLPISGDQTRVLACVTFPLVAIFLLLNRPFLELVSDREAAAGLLIWALVPWSWVWGGLPKWSVFPHDVVFVLNRLFGWFEVPADPTFWPF